MVYQEVSIIYYLISPFLSSKHDLIMFFQWCPSHTNFKKFIKRNNSAEETEEARTARNNRQTNQPASLYSTQDVLYVIICAVHYWQPKLQSSSLLLSIFIKHRFRLVGSGHKKRREPNCIICPLYKVILGTWVLINFISHFISLYMQLFLSFRMS